MALLDFIKNRKTQQQSASPEVRSETAKQKYARETSQEKANTKPLDRITADQMAKVDGIKADLQRATRGVDRSARAPAQPDATANPQPMAQMSMNQDKAAPALSPTTAQAGTRSTEQDGPALKDAVPSQKPDRPQTTARRPSSWER